MVDAFSAENVRFQVIKANKIAFDTDNPSVSLFPLAVISLNNYVVNFPNLLSSIVYIHKGTAGNPYYCETWSGLLPQEHGPGYGNYSPDGSTFLANGIPVKRKLSSVIIGTVPVGTTYLDVRARLARTITPPIFNKISPPIMFFPQNEWINLPGGSCPVEYFSPLAREFDVVLSGTDVVLNRYQSVANLGQVASSTGGNTNNVTSTQFGAAWGNYNNSIAQWATPCVWFDNRGFDGFTNKRPPWGTTSTGSCDIGTVQDYTSEYQVDFEITPGRYQP